MSWEVDTRHTRTGTVVVVRRKVFWLCWEVEEVGRVAFDRESSCNRDRSHDEQLEIVRERAAQRAAVLTNWNRNE